MPASGKKNNVSGRKPRQIVTLSHPDFNRRPRNYTGSADLQKQPEALAGFQFILHIAAAVATQNMPDNDTDLPPVGNFTPP
ncbi:hypothetical protein BN137_1304 [Cronobacter condimenti 1330]|uniref:Uncharacterized protein n=1 Tax=Cronobacter condimenti 1330 TaxID=1073999 RepID=K7ZZ70_9ENTR|nr:hypothetical protein BN137_1304 [Cronobacter condimenti 1330]